MSDETASTAPAKEEISQQPNGDISRVSISVDDGDIDLFDMVIEFDTDEEDAAR